MPVPSKGEAVKQRSRAGGEPVKTQRHKTVTLKRRDAPRAVRGRSQSIADLREELDRRSLELHEALEQQTAMTEVLHLMSGPRADLAHLFDTILANATRLSDANFGMLSLYEGEAFRVVGPGPLVRVAATKQLLHISDITKDPAPDTIINLTEVRTLLAVPLLNDNDLVGTIVVYRTTVRPFTDKQIDLVKNFASQAVIAIENARLLNELRQRTTDRCSTSCENRSSSRPERPAYSRPSAGRLSTCRPYSAPDDSSRCGQ
jgi:transcriptional regulator with GAF, ATPase, and Fis domain